MSPKNKIILFQGDLWVIDDIRDNDVIVMSKLESNAEVKEFSLKSEIFEDFCFEHARLDAIDVMNQTRYFDNVLSKEKDNKIM